MEKILSHLVRSGELQEGGLGVAAVRERQIDGGGDYIKSGWFLQHVSRGFPSFIAVFLNTPCLVL